MKKTKNNNPQIKRSYRRVRVEDVMREADYLLPMTYDERMRFCLFRYDPKADVEPTGKFNTLLAGRHFEIFFFLFFS